MTMFTRSKEYATTPKFSFLPVSFKVIFLIIACGKILFAEKVVPDLFPVSIGNSWTFALKTGGTREYTVASPHKDSLIFIEKNNTSGYTYIDSFEIIFHDSLGYFNKPLSRDLSNTLWGPHCAIAEDHPLTTPAGTFSRIYTYPLSWGHPSGGSQSVIASPGVGCIAIGWNGILGCETPYCILDTFAMLQSYNIIPKPQATWVDTVCAPTGGAEFNFTYLHGDSGLVTIRMPRPSCTKYMVSSSFNPIAKVLRIYFVDTAQVACNATDTVYYSLKLHNLEKDSSYDIAIYNAFFDTLIDLFKDIKYPLKTEKIYFQRINCLSTSIAMGRRNNFAAKERRLPGIYDISGRLIYKNHQGLSGKNRRHPGGSAQGIFIVKGNQGNIKPLIITRE